METGTCVYIIFASYMHRRKILEERTWNNRIQNKITFYLNRSSVMTSHDQFSIGTEFDHPYRSACWTNFQQLLTRSQFHDLDSSTDTYSRMNKCHVSCFFSLDDKWLPCDWSLKMIFDLLLNDVDILFIMDLTQQQQSLHHDQPHQGTWHGLCNLRPQLVLTFQFEYSTR